MISAALKLSPVEAPAAVLAITEALTIADILARVEAPDWFWQVGVVRLNGHVIPRENWRRVRVKPDADGVLDLCVVPQGRNTLGLLATLATVALVAGISGGLLGPAGLGLGASFAAGGIGASLTAAGVGIAGQLLVSALTAPPKLGGSQQEAGRQESLAGVSGNAVSLLGTLPVVFGKVGISPPILAPVYTTFDKEEVFVHAVVGVEGRCLIENVLVNDTDYSLFGRMEVETREGAPGDTDRTIANITVIEQRDSVVLSNFRTILATSINDELVDQVNPDAASPDYHYFTTATDVDEVWIRLLFPAGIVNTSLSQAGMVPLRIEARRLGDTAWRKFPTCHIWDERRGTGPLRAEVKIKFKASEGGQVFSNADSVWPISDLTAITGNGQAFEYEADTYFQNTAWDIAGILPTMTGATTSGVTMSASSTSGGNAAYLAADGSTATFWIAAANSLPAWLKVDLGSAQTVKSWMFATDVSAPNLKPTYAPTEWYVEGSNDDVTYTRLDDENYNTNGVITQWTFCQIGNPGSYRYYRFNFLANNGAASEDLRIGNFELYTWNCPGTHLAAEVSSTYGYVARDNFTLDPRCVNGRINQNGAIFYLDPAEWLPGVWEFRFKRGIAVSEQFMTYYSYAYNGSAVGADFFDYRLSSGKYVVGIGQSIYRSDMHVEVFASVNNDEPFDPDGVALIALKVPNLNVDSIYAEFTRYAPVWDGTIWTPVETPTQNPAALYRQLLLGGGNNDPLPGEIIDHGALSDWYERCATAGHQCNAVKDGAAIRDVLQMIAMCGYASPRHANTWGVVEDYDTSALPISQMLTPLNSRDGGTEILLPNVPHAIRAEYFDQADDYDLAHAITYRDGYSAANATLFETVTYDGITDAAKIATRAAFDLDQAVFRSRRYMREVGVEGYTIERGALIGISDDILDVAQCYGIVRHVTITGGYVTSVRLDSILPLSAGSGDILAVENILDLDDILDTDQPMAIAIRLEDGTVLTKMVNEVTDSNTCTFATPFADTGVVVPGVIAAAGVLGREFRRCRVMSVEPSGADTRKLFLADEAPELFGSAVAASTASDELLGAATDGVAVNYTFNAMTIRDTVTPANNFSGAPADGLTSDTLASTEFNLSATAGTLILKATTGATVPENLLQIDDGSESNRVRVSRNAANSIRLLITAGGVAQANIDLGTVANDTEIHVAVAWALNDVAGSLDGAAATADASASLPGTPTILRIGKTFTGTDSWSGTIEEVRYLPVRTTNALLALYSAI